MISTAIQRYRGMVKPLLIAGILALSYLFGSGKTILPPRWLLVGIAGLAVAVWLLKDLRPGLTLLLLTAATVNFSIGTGTQSSINLAMLLLAGLGGIWLVKMLIDRSVRLVPTPLNLPLIAFLVTAGISWIFSFVIFSFDVYLPSNIPVVQAGQYILFVLTAIAFWLPANYPIEERVLKIWVVFITLFGATFVLLRSFIGRSDLFPGWTGGLAMWPFVFIVSNILFNRDLDRRIKTLGAGVILLWIFWVIKYSLIYKSIWVPASLAILMLIWMKSKKFFLFTTLALVAVAAIISVPTIVSKLTEEERYSATPMRWAMWVDVFRMGARSALLGLGPATYTYYWQDESFNSLSYEYLQEVNPYAFTRAVYAPPAHNMFADIFAQTGLFGLFFLCWALGAGVWLALQVRKRNFSSFERAYANAVLAGFIALIIASFIFAEWLLPYVYNLGLSSFRQSLFAWLFLGTLVHLGTRKQPEKETRTIAR